MLSFLRGACPLSIFDTKSERPSLKVASFIARLEGGCNPGATAQRATDLAVNESVVKCPSPSKNAENSYNQMHL